MNTITFRRTATSSFAVVALLALAGCGSDAASSGSSDTSAKSAPSATEESSGYGEPAATEPADISVADTVPTDSGVAADAPILIAENDLGSILTDANGLTVYAFTTDVDGVSTCNDGCAGAWPPVVVDASFDVSTLPASGSFSLIERDDGTTQLKSGDSPLYTFSGDSAAGDTNGQGSGGVWFVVAADGSLVK